MPTHSVSTSRWRNIEIGLLASFAFVLPLYEAPKNIFWFLFLLLWIFNRLRDQSLPAKWQPWDTVFALLIIAPYLGAPFAGIEAHQWDGARDVVRYGLLGWALSRTQYGQAIWLRILAFLSLGCLIALAWGMWDVYVGNAADLELNSVGHVNHSAVYLTMVFGTTLAYVMARWQGTNKMHRALALLVALLLATGVVMSASRIAVLVAILTALILAGVLWRTSRKPLLVLLILLGLSAGVMALDPPWLVQKQLRNMSDNNILANRNLIWERAVVAWQENPVFGIGMDNFNQIHTPLYQKWLAHLGKPYVASRDYGTSHAHSIFFNTLAERGVLGLSVLILLLGAWLVSLWKNRPLAHHAFQWTSWAASVAAWMATFGIGIFNTTLQTENGLLAMLLLGMWLSNRQPASPK